MTTPLFNFQLARRSFPRGASIALVFASFVLAMCGCMASASGKRVVQTAVVLNHPGIGPALDGARAYLSEGNPLKIVCRTRAEAQQLANAYLAEYPGSALYVTSGSSMEPFITARSLVVAQPRPYQQIQKGELLIYMGRPDADRADRTCMLHRAVLQDRDGWLMCGDNNRWTETWDRVTPANYMGTAVVVLEAREG
jgi:hypothetical protein